MSGKWLEEMKDSYAFYMATTCKRGDFPLPGGYFPGCFQDQAVCCLFLVRWPI